MTQPAEPESSEKIRLTPLAKGAWQDYRRSWPALILFELVIKGLEAVVVLPALALLLTFVLAQSGRVALSNWDILNFLTTPLGWLYAFVLVTATVGAFLVEQAGIMAIVAGTSPDRNVKLKQVSSLVLRAIARLVKLGAMKAILLALVIMPFVLLALLTYGLLLTGHDLYFYLSTRPSAFWFAAVIFGLLGIAALGLGTMFFVRWSLAVPILLFESHKARAALRESRLRTRGVRWRMAAILLGWQVFVLAGGAIALWILKGIAGSVLDWAGEGAVGWILLFILIQGTIAAGVTVTAVLGQSVLVWRLYQIRNEALGIEVPTPDADEIEAQVPRWCKYIVYLPMTLALLGLPAVWMQLDRFRQVRPPVQVTAHRGHARVAPENTLSAIRRAIESGADYAEIDVQRTADGVVVLLHDRDLKRVAGDSRRLTDLRYDDIRNLDVGSWFAPEFANERIPTLAEVIDASKGKIKLNIELKLFGPDQGLTRAVADIIREKGVQNETLVTSFDPNILAEMKKLVPGVRTGLIVAQALGDVSREDVDVLNFRVDHLTDARLAEARRRGREVHVWTVNDASQMYRQIKRGVDNILTSDPDLLIQVRKDWESLSPAERLVLSARLLLGLEP